MKRSMVALFFLVLLCTSRFAAAGPFADDMAKCLVNSTSPADRTLLVKWIFSVIALHPDLSAMVATTGSFSDPHVAEGTKDLAKYLDEDKLKALAPPGGAKN